MFCLMVCVCQTLELYILTKRKPEDTHTKHKSTRMWGVSQDGLQPVAHDSHCITNEWHGHTEGGGGRGADLSTLGNGYFSVEILSLNTKGTVYKYCLGFCCFFFSTGVRANSSLHIYWG